MITDEKRAFRRVKRKFTVRYNFQGPDGAKGKSVSENISLGGVYFISLMKMNIGDILECDIEMLSCDGHGRFLARVVRCESLNNNMVDTFGIAVEFTKAFGDSRKKLEKALSSSV
ncbi:MAG: hypothetical protein GF409_08645 [Candidatus Omnitrophica bacterium]|nr:hypothetical protein [Candidatus Omnitrophota bacterium]